MYLVLIPLSEYALLLFKCCTSIYEFKAIEFNCLNRQLLLTNDSKLNGIKRKELVPLGKKKLGVCGRMPGDPHDQIDFTVEGNTVGIDIFYLIQCFLQ